METWRQRGVRFLHDVASRTVASLLGAGILAIAAGGTFYWWRRELVWWFRDRTYLDNWTVAVVAAVVLGLAVAVALLAVKLKRLRQRDYWLSPPWAIRDTGMHLEWRLRRRPESWVAEDLHAAAPTHVGSLIQGPFHGRRLSSGELCLELLVVPTDEGERVPTSCPRCGATIYDDWKGCWDLYWLKRRTLEGLRRDEQLGKRIKSGYSGDFILPYVGD